MNLEQIRGGIDKYVCYSQGKYRILQYDHLVEFFRRIIMGKLTK